ncbi:MAG: polyprenyl synthetase family protein [Dehalococcoidia bacterium]
MTSVTALYGPAAEDLGLVEDTLELVTRSDFAPLERMLKSVLGRGGKRLRPVIALLAGGFGEYDVEKQVPLAASIELLHTATLVHDDVIDAAPIRRGQPTANASFDNAASVMLGDYMFAHAAELVARTGNVGVIRLFAETLMAMAKGELNQDISAYDAASGNLRDYYQRISGKTASLFATAGAGGAMMADCDRATVETLRSYGRNLGMAFQIVDDVLDFTGDAQQLGKPVGGDLLAGTLTLPSILLMEDQPDDNPVSRLFATNEEAERQQHLNAALDRIRESDILDRSWATAREWGGSALQALHPLRQGEQRESLAAITRFVTQRDF